MATVLLLWFATLQSIPFDFCKCGPACANRNACSQCPEQETSRPAHDCCGNDDPATCIEGHRAGSTCLHASPMTEILPSDTSRTESGKVLHARVSLAISNPTQPRVTFPSLPETVPRSSRDLYLLNGSLLI